MKHIIKFVGFVLLNTHLQLSITSILGFIDYLKTNQNDKNIGFDYILNEIKIMDLEVKIQMIILMLNRKQNEKLDELEELYIKNLEDLIKEIEINTTNIHRIIEQHKMKWFYSWRNFDVSIELEELKRLNKILFDRITLGYQFRIF